LLELAAILHVIVVSCFESSAGQCESAEMSNCWKGISFVIFDYGKNNFNHLLIVQKGNTWMAQPTSLVKWEVW
jgi:hypothetical protein